MVGVTHSHPWAHLSECLQGIKRILDVARKIRPRIPIIFSTMGFSPDFSEISEVWRKKMPILSQQVLGSRWVELVPELERQSDEPLIVKKHNSCFVHTSLLEMLISAKVDTVIITGCSTSGCVHATCEDAAHFGYHSIVVYDAVGDRDPSLAVPFLIDMDAKKGDVVSVDDVLEYLGRMRR